MKEKNMKNRYKLLKRCFENPSLKLKNITHRFSLTFIPFTNSLILRNENKMYKLSSIFQQIQRNILIWQESIAYFNNNSTQDCKLTKENEKSAKSVLK